MRCWKVLGLAGAAGVVATGVVVVRAERRRRAYTPDQVREQLHVRFAQATAAAETGEGAQSQSLSGAEGQARRFFARLRRVTTGRCRRLRGAGPRGAREEPGPPQGGS